MPQRPKTPRVCACICIPASTSAGARILCPDLGYARVHGAFFSSDRAALGALSQSQCSGAREGAGPSTVFCPPETHFPCGLQQRGLQCSFRQYLTHKPGTQTSSTFSERGGAGEGGGWMPLKWGSYSLG